MRLTCPSCAAIYEVEDIAIPASGRRVRCTACDAAWRVAGDGAAIVRTRVKLSAIASRASEAFAEQERVAQAESPSETEGDAGRPPPEAEPEPTVAARSAPPVSEDSAPPAPPGETAAQPEAPKPDAAAATDRVADAAIEKSESVSAPAPRDSTPARESGRAETAGEPESEFRTFKPLRMRPPPVVETDDDDDVDATERTSPLRSILGFLVGFALVLVLFSPYLFREQIISAAPSLEPFVEGYADTVRWAQSGVRGVYEAIAEQVRYLVDPGPPPQ